MKNIIALCVLLVSLTANGVASNPTPDAVIELDNRTIAFQTEKYDSKTLTYSTTTTVKRRIRINSQWGLDQFAELYIPSYKRNDVNFQIIYLNAQTLKKDGTVRKVDRDKIKETTLPANVPFLYGYKGNVKQLAFEGVELGDVIEYDYMTRLSYNAPEDIMSTVQTWFLGNEYPVLQGNITIQTHDKRLGQNVHLTKHDGSIDIESNGNETLVNFRNLPGYRKQLFENPYDQKSFLTFHVFSNKGVFHFDSWNEIYDKWIDNSPKKKEDFFGGISLAEFAETAKKESTVLGKINSLRDQIQSIYEKDAYRSWVIYQNYSADLYDVSQVFRLMELIEVDASVLFLKKKANGPVIKDILSTSQFDGMILEFSDESGKVHYWDIFTTYRNVDEVSYEYNRTEALKLRLNRNKEEIDWIQFTVPALTHEIVWEHEVQIALRDDKMLFNTTKSVEYSGQYDLMDREVFLIENLDENVDLYSSRLIKNLKNKHIQCEVEDIELLAEKGNQAYVARYQFILPFHSEEFISFSISELVRNAIRIPQSQEYDRTTDAYLSFPNSKMYQLTLHAPAGYKFEQNRYLNRIFENELGEINATASNESTMLKLEINLETKKNHILATSWGKFVEFVDNIDDYLCQKVLLVEDK